MLQLFIRTVFSTVSSKFGNVVISLRTSQSAVAHWRLSRAHRLKPAKIPRHVMVFLGSHRRLCPKVRLILLQSSYRVKDEPSLEQAPSSDLAPGTEKEEQCLLPCVFNDPSAHRQEFWRKAAFSNKGNENSASWPRERSERCGKLGETGN